MKNIVSLSGGHTSSTLPDLLKSEGVIVDEYIFMDTGAEHPETYAYLRKVENHFDIQITCLRLIVTKLGDQNKWDVVTTADIGPDLKPFRECLKGYSTPTVNHPMCTGRMKSEIFANYCKQKYGNGNFITWMGIRYDEPQRLFGKRPYKTMLDAGYQRFEMVDIYMAFMSADDVNSVVESYIYPALDSIQVREMRETIVKKIKKTKKDNFKYMAEISDFTKTDVLGYWQEMPFDLMIPEWLGNCVFCVHKGANKIGLATIDEPELADQFIQLVESDEVRAMPNRKSKVDMYRGHLSLREIRDQYKDMNREDIILRLRSDGSTDSGSCSESCEVFNDQIDLF